MSTLRPQSFQLPDILSTLSSLELRTSKHCRSATQHLEQWIAQNALGATDQERATLSSGKIGLLTALCFPTCDAPQLRRLAEASAVLIFSDICVFGASGSSMIDSSSVPEPESDGLNESVDSERQDAEPLDFLKQHDIYKQLRVPLALLYVWYTGAEISLQVCSIQQPAASLRPQSKALNMTRTDIPTIDEYMEVRRDVHSLDIFLLLAELHEVFVLPELDETQHEHIQKLKTHAFNVISWSIDVVAYQRMSKHSQTSRLNLITILMHYRALSLQGAVNTVGSMIKDAFASFTAEERSLLGAPSQSRSSSLTSILYDWFGWSSTDAPALDNAEAEIGGEAEEIRRYVQVLKDCMIGVINWVYESELFFGTKGGEVRSFGWVFTSQD